MRVIIAGSRAIEDYNLVETAIHESGFCISEVVSGKARGIDTLGEEWAAYHSIPVKPFPANWQKHGVAAGPIRNEEMARYADALIAIRQGGTSSKGTTNMINLAQRYCLQVFVKEVAP